MSKEKNIQVQEGHPDEEKRQFCTFWISGRLFGVDIKAVKEITSELDFTPIYHAPGEINGYVNIRGQINLVVDLRMLLGFQKQEIDNNSRVVLFKPEVGESFGVLVDKIGDVIDAEESLIEWREDGKNQKGKKKEKELSSELEMGVCKLDKQLLVILDAAKVLSQIEKNMAA